MGWGPDACFNFLRAVFFLRVGRVAAEKGERATSVSHRCNDTNTVKMSQIFMEMPLSPLVQPYVQAVRAVISTS